MPDGKFLLLLSKFFQIGSVHQFETERGCAFRLLQRMHFYDIALIQAGQYPALVDRVFTLKELQCHHTVQLGIESLKCCAETSFP